jgi:hypothetical protein
MHAAIQTGSLRMLSTAFSMILTVFPHPEHSKSMLLDIVMVNELSTKGASSVSVFSGNGSSGDLGLLAEKGQSA